MVFTREVLPVLVLARLYYELVDAGAIDHVLALFSPDVVYQRCEREIRGDEELRDFYENGRKINGRHFIDGVVAVPDHVGVQGRFSGSARDGSPLEIRFADVFQIRSVDDNHWFSARHTYLHTEHLRHSLSSWTQLRREGIGLLKSFSDGVSSVEEHLLRPTAAGELMRLECAIFITPSGVSAYSGVGSTLIE
jgi:ketosteroid isomerase-like protein